MISTNIDSAKYGRLCAQAVPKVIENDEEFSRMADYLEVLDAKANPTTEETALADLLSKLIEDYDSLHHPLPPVEPHRVVATLMEQRGLKQADLVALIGSRAQVSDMVSGKRGISKAQAKKLADYFRVSTDLFI